MGGVADGANGGHYNSMLSATNNNNFQNLTAEGFVLDDDLDVVQPDVAEPVIDEGATDFGPVDQMRIQGIQELLSQLNFIDMQLDLELKRRSNSSSPSSSASPGSSLQELIASPQLSSADGILSGLGIRTQREIETASEFLSSTNCYFPLNGSPSVSKEEWMYYLASRAQSYEAEEGTAVDSILKELPWATFPILCQNSTFNVPQWLGKYDWMNDMVTSVEIPVYAKAVGRIPESIGNLSKLRTLSLQGGVEGTIPPSIGELQELTSLMLQNNDLIGSIPPEIGNCTSLVKLWVFNNELTGSIPDDIADLDSLEEFFAQDNQLTGQVTPALVGVQQKLGRNFAITGNPMWAETQGVAATRVEESELEGWEIALIVVVAIVAAASAATLLVWAVRRGKLAMTASMRDLAMKEFEDDCETQAMFCINRKDLQLVKLVGRGTYGSVFEAKWNGNPVAVKIMNVMDSQVHSREESRKYIRTFEKEVEFLSQFKHRNVVKLFGYSLVSPHVYIVQELLSQNLSQVTRSKQYKPDDLKILKIIQDISTGLSYLHPRIVHCDLKPQNILLSSKGEAKIADFGISKGKQGTFIQFTKHAHVPGSVIYMAPECFNSPEEVGEKCDVYSLAMIIWECYTGCEPWEELPSPISVVNAVAVQNRRPLIPENVPRDITRLIRKCWCTEYHKRPSCAEIAKLCELMIKDRKALSKDPSKLMQSRTL
ncbi:serine/threonine-protein kinase [Chloropicon primus]|uniref:Serine/threonine-protein kinase n=1 Tax=Chloropicon primus TaxID=1764295 RepID=A0A5B8MTN7_9CHLO|nr:serine/threonine-protein kinase [Chloropicon primus]|eukprot:QDZ22800.1 serine/threonine-protein kinase [Chloropicon primus]